MSVCSFSRGSRSTFTTLLRLGSGQVEQLQLKLSRPGRSSTRYSPLTRNSVPPSSISIRSRPPTRGSDSTFRHRAGRGHIESESALGSSHSSYATSGDAGSMRRTTATRARGSVTGALLPREPGGKRIGAVRPEGCLLGDPVPGGGEPLGADRQPVLTTAHSSPNQPR